MSSLFIYQTECKAMKYASSGKMLYAITESLKSNKIMPIFNTHRISIGIFVKLRCAMHKLDAMHGILLNAVDNFGIWIIDQPQYLCNLVQRFVDCTVIKRAIMHVPRVCVVCAQVGLYVCGVVLYVNHSMHCTTHSHIVFQPEKLEFHIKPEIPISTHVKHNKILFHKHRSLFHFFTVQFTNMNICMSKIADGRIV